MKARPANSHSLFSWDPRLWPKSHNLTLRYKISTVNWHLRWFSCSAFVEGYFCVFKNKYNRNWSLTRKFRINVSLALYGLPCSACWFHCLILRLFDFSMPQKEEFAFSVLLWNQRNLSEKAWYTINPQKKGMKHFLGRLFLFCFVFSQFEILSIKFLFLFLNKMLQFLKTEVVFCDRKEIIVISHYPEDR